MGGLSEADREKVSLFVDEMRAQREQRGCWRKATYSSGNGTNCVEAGVTEPGRVLVRDTTDRDGGTLAFTAEAWQRFTDGLR